MAFLWELGLFFVFFPFPSTLAFMNVKTWFGILFLGCTPSLHSAFPPPSSSSNARAVDSLSHLTSEAHEPSVSQVLLHPALEVLLLLDSLHMRVDGGIVSRCNCIWVTTAEFGI